MAVNYTIQSEVVDIQQDAPKPEDTFLVDTNVWYWMTYTHASQSAWPYQISNYPDYTKKALDADATIYQSGVSQAELTHLIEKTERQIYEASAGKIGAKEYRHNFPDERVRVCAEIEAACGLVSMLGGVSFHHHR